MAQRASKALSFFTRRVVRRQRRVWSRRSSSWDHHGSEGLTKVTAAALAAAAVRPGDRVLDIGSGQGQLSLPLASAGAVVTAVDVSPAMIAELRSRAQAAGLADLRAMAMPAEELVLPMASFDVIVSSYALHHLRDADKARLVFSAFAWLRPGGRLIIADMMFGRGGSERDREIIRQKLGALVRKGPGGWWRVAKNAGRYLFRVHERPVSMDTWTRMLRDAGFASIAAAGIVAEAGLVTAARPGSGAGAASVPAQVGEQA